MVVEKGRIRKRSPDVADRFLILIFTWGGVVESDCGWKEKHKKKITGYGAGERIRGGFYI